MARRVPREQGLSRILGASALFSAAYGNVGSSIYYALGVTAAFALGLTPVAFLIAGFIFICTAATYAEGTVMYPEAGGSSSFARHAFNEVISFIAAWGQMLNYVITASISAYFVPHYLAVFWEPLGRAPADIVAGAIVIVALAALNIRGTKESARFNLVLTVVDIATQVVLVGIGVFLVLSPDVLVSNVHLGVAPTWPDFALGIAVGMIAYTGIETISNMSEEARDAARTVPQGVILVVITVLALYAFIPIVALSAMPVFQLPDGSFVTELGTTYADDPILGIVDNLGVSGGLADALRIYVGVLAAVILLIATNAGMIGVSRLSYSMGQYRQLPEAIRRVHPKYRTPYVAITFFAVAAIITLIPGRADFLATLYSFGAMLSFTIAHAAVIRLRQTEPDAEREWMPPLNIRIKGRLLPLTALIGGLGTFAAWLVVMALNPVTLVVGLCWMAVGIVVYLFYRRYQNLPLRESVRIVMPEPLGVEEIEYRSVVIGLRSGEALSDQLVATALALTSQTRRAIHVVPLVVVPADLPLDADLPEADGKAKGEIERGRIEAGLRVTGQIERVRPGEEGYSLDRLARSLQAEAVIVSMPTRDDGRPIYDKVLQTLLERRPCRVIVVSEETGEAR